MFQRSAKTFRQQTNSSRGSTIHTGVEAAGLSGTDVSHAGIPKGLSKGTPTGVPVAEEKDFAKVRLRGPMLSIEFPHQSSPTCLDDQFLPLGFELVDASVNGLPNPGYRITRPEEIVPHTGKEKPSKKFKDGSDFAGRKYATDFSIGPQNGEQIPHFTRVNVAANNAQGVVR